MAMVVATMDAPVIAAATELALKSLWRESIVHDASGGAVELGSIQAKAWLHPRNGSRLFLGVRLRGFTSSIFEWQGV
jgi:hypothetical protein